MYYAAVRKSPKGNVDSLPRPPNDSTPYDNHSPVSRPLLSTTVLFLTPSALQMPNSPVLQTALRDVSSATSRDGLGASLPHSVSLPARPAYPRARDSAGSHVLLSVLLESLALTCPCHQSVMSDETQ